MREPFVRPLEDTAAAENRRRAPRVFVASEARDAPETVEVLTDTGPDDGEEPIRRGAGLSRRLSRIAWVTGGLLIALGIGLAAERLIGDLFATSAWLGWAGVALLALCVVALAALALREIAGLVRLRVLDRLREQATKALLSDKAADGRHVAAELLAVYARRADLAKARDLLERDVAQVFDGSEHIRLAERLLMGPLDARAKALTAGSARRVALVTTVAPRALVDIAFVIFESVRLGGAIARLYGARPGLFGTWRLVGAILTHLAVTGGLVLTDGVVEQLVGQGLAARLSARLGEGVVNGLMTVRVGIAAMRVVRPLPYTALPQPVVKDFIPELANVTAEDGR